jgi:trehalose 6-phosphate phosphatase
VTPGDLAARVAAAAATTALVCDFDGTLSPIVDDPATSQLPPEAAAHLADLVPRLGLVAVVSGRPVAFLSDRVAVPGVRLYGLYGLEEQRDGAVVVAPEVAGWDDAVETARAALAAAVPVEPDLRLEDKGRGLAVHWRGAADPDDAAARARALVERVADETGLAREPGKLVEELRPPVAWNKGDAVRAAAAAAGGGLVVYVGDDLGDLPAFAAATALSGLCVAVDHGAETPGAVRAAADLVVAGAEGVTALLAALVAAVPAPPPPPAPSGPEK